MSFDPWYKVVTARKEVQEGRSFNRDEFAIALEQVVAGTAPEDYRDPAQFFARTCFHPALREHAGIGPPKALGEDRQHRAGCSRSSPSSAAARRTRGALGHRQVQVPRVYPWRSGRSSQNWDLPKPCGWRRRASRPRPPSRHAGFARAFGVAPSILVYFTDPPTLFRTLTLGLRQAKGIMSLG